MSESELQPIGLKNRIDNNLKLSIPKPNINFNNIRNYPSTAPTTSDARSEKRSHQLGDLTMVKNLIRNLDNNNQDYFNTSPLSSSSSPAAAVMASSSKRFYICT